MQWQKSLLGPYCEALPQNSGSGLSLVPKLKYEHVYLTSSKMRVDLAAQVYIHTYVHLSGLVCIIIKNIDNYVKSDFYR